MIKEEIAPGIVIYSNVIPDSENLYKDIEEGMFSANIQWSSAGVTEGGKSGLNKSSRDTSIIGVEYQGKINNENTTFANSFYNGLNNIFFTSFDLVEKDYQDIYNVRPTWHDQYGILKYGVGQKFINHVDDGIYHRRISTVYYLNNNYTGGEINFPRFNINFKPKANQMIIFPSTYVYNHSVSPVIDGERYAVVSWMK